jgi:hypothetical protein
LTSVCSSQTALSGASTSISWWPRTRAPAPIPVGLPPRPARDQRVKLPRGVISSTASRPRPDRSRPWINHPPASRSSWVPPPQPTALWSTAHAPRSLRDDLGDVRLTDTSVKIVSPSSKIAAATDMRHNGSPGFSTESLISRSRLSALGLTSAREGGSSGQILRRFTQRPRCHGGDATSVAPLLQPIPRRLLLIFRLVGRDSQGREQPGGNPTLHLARIHR